MSGALRLTRKRCFKKKKVSNASERSRKLRTKLYSSECTGKMDEIPDFYKLSCEVGGTV